MLQNAAESIQARLEDHSDDSDPTPGRVSVSLERLPDAVRILVADNGRGLPVQDRDRLTEPYVTTREKGTGLGLAIVKKIMEDHGGSVVLKDGNDGGALVELRFEVTTVAEAPSSTNDPEETGTQD